MTPSKFQARRKKILTALIAVFAVLNMLVITAVPVVQAKTLFETAEDIFSGISKDNTAKTSFTEFTGGLEQPSTAGYSAGLVQATSARQYIINVTNFALGFLGLIAIIIIIYGGFLYVTAAGKEDQAGKGKKAVTYAIIGIILILGSYALVNTLLLAPSGSDTGTLSGAAPGTTTSAADENARRRSLFNLAGVEVQTIAREFLTAYQNYTEIKIAIIELENIPEVNTSADLRSLLEDKKRILENIKSKAGPLSNVNEKSQGALNVVNSYLQLSSKALADAANDETVWYEFWNDGHSEFEDKLKTETGEGGLKTANEDDFALAVYKTYQKIIDLEDRVSSVVSLPEIAEAFKNVKDDLTAIVANVGSAQMSFVPFAHAAELELTNPEVSNQEILSLIEEMAVLRDALKDIQFVYAAITADAVEGSAPLVVNLDGLKSLDPLNRTIPTLNFVWDFDGDGTDDTGSGASPNGPTQNHIFTEPGTYRVRLKVVSPDEPTEKQIADGLAFATVTVRPAVIKINLKATVGDDAKSYPLKTYDNATGRLINDVSILKVTPSEAQLGITFDAGETDQTKNKIAKVRWNFGDSSPDVIGDTTQLKQIVKYPAAGNYKVTLELTDTLNNVDRKIVNVIVGSPLARVTVIPGTEGNVNEEFSFDAGDSASDGGQIKSYMWKYDAEENEGATYKKTFAQPGPQTVILTVTDNLDKTDTTTIQLNVTSKPPVSEFSYRFPDPKQPGTVYLDGTRSYDPDNEKSELTYQWEINGQKTNEDTDFIYVAGTTSVSAKPVVRFKNPGTHAVTLMVTDKNGFGEGKPQEGEPEEKELEVTNTLDVAWDVKDVTTGIMKPDTATGENSAEITLNLLSENGVAYEVNFGDGEKENGDISKTKAIKHTYKQAGTFVVKASVFDSSDSENTISRKVFIGSSSTPVALITVKVNGSELTDTTEPIEINRKDVVTFDASNSKNTDGTGRRLNYSWDFGDGEKSTSENSNHTYKELGEYKISLKVVNANDVSQTAIDNIQLKVSGTAPTLRSITAAPTTSSNTTPVAIQLSALGAEDVDGKVVRYHWWYYDPSNDTDRFGDQITSGPTATINIGTRGEEGEEKTYQFAVELTDDENNTVSSKDLLDSNKWPTLSVTNGPNKAPIAKFTVDRTSIMVGESVNFSSASADADGSILHYYWDWEGDGFANNTQDEGSNVTHTFDKPAKDGVRVKLKVVDNNESEATSDAVTIYVDSKAQPPVAGFTSAQQGETKTVKFTSTSTADAVNGASIEKYSWDFDVKVDANGDGKPENDSESTEQAPSHEYPNIGLYKARLSVTDSDGQTSSVENLVYLKAAATPPPAPAPAPTPKPAAPALDARLLTTPAPSFVDSKVHLQGETGDVTFDFSTSTGNIKSYIIDKNLFFDTNGNGIKEDDEDYKTATPGSWKTNFAKSFGQIRVRLTVVDDTGKKDTVDKDIVFDATAGSTFTANVFNSFDPGIAALLVTAAGFVILNLKRPAKSGAKTKQK